MDTIKVKDDERKEVSVRMIGIDAPESRPNKRLGLQMRQQDKDQKTILELGEKSNATFLYPEIWKGISHLFS